MRTALHGRDGRTGRRNKDPIYTMKVGPAGRGAWLLVIACSVGHGGQAAEVFKWTDADGKVHFGDRPPAQGASSVTVRTAPAAAGAAERHERTRALLDSYEREAEAAAKTSRARDEQEARREKACKAAAYERRRLEHAGRIYTWEDNGERRFLEGREYDDAIAHAREDAERACE